jgi:ElaB/YqjD/DUF883 family membrane-anchored ribosome-binding protein
MVVSAGSVVIRTVSVISVVQGEQVMAAAKKPSTEKEFDASKEAVKEALDKLMEARVHFQHAAELAGLDLKSETVEQLGRGKEKAEQLSEQLNQYTREKPLTALAVAFVGGFIMSQLLKK